MLPCANHSSTEKSSYNSLTQTEIIEKSQLLKHEKKMSMALAILLVHDLLFGKLISSPFKQRILSHKARLHAELVKIKIKMKARTNAELIPSHIRDAIVLPRYVRVNILKTTVKATVKHFLSQGYTLTEGELVGKQFKHDEHLEDLLLLPPNSDLHEDKFLLNGNIILQDKASCFPAFILNPPKGSVIM
jgi:25S rRNA (cytosine2278-C5)-methyltransferase